MLNGPIFLIITEFVILIISLGILFKRSSSKGLKCLLLIIPLTGYLFGFISSSDDAFFHKRLPSLYFIVTPWIIGVIISRPKRIGQRIIEMFYIRITIFIGLFVLFIFNYDSLRPFIPMYDSFTKQDMSAKCSIEYFEEQHGLLPISSLVLKPIDFAVRIYLYEPTKGTRVIEFIEKDRTYSLRRFTALDSLTPYDTLFANRLQDSLISFKVWEMQSIERKYILDALFHFETICDGGHQSFSVLKDGRESFFQIPTSDKYSDHRYNWFIDNLDLFFK